MIPSQKKYHISPHISVTPDGAINPIPLSTIPLTDPLKAVEYSDNYVIHISSNEEKCWIDIWTITPCAFYKRMELKDQKVLLSEPFGSQGWSKDGNKYVLTTHSTKNADEFEYKQDWGEQLEGVSDTQINIIDAPSGDLHSFSAPPGYSAAQGTYSSKHDAIFYIGYSTTPRRYGLIYCGNRPSALFKYDMQTKQSTMLTNNCDSIRSPFLNPTETAILYLTNSVFVAHRKCCALVSFDLETTTTDTIIPVSDVNFISH